MNRNLLFILLGLLLLMSGVLLASLLTIIWVVLGTLFAVIGGTTIGINAYLLGAKRKGERKFDI